MKSNYGTRTSSRSEVVQHNREIAEWERQRAAWFEMEGCDEQFSAKEADLLRRVCMPYTAELEEAIEDGIEVPTWREHEEKREEKAKMRAVQMARRQQGVVAGNA